MTIKNVVVPGKTLMEISKILSGDAESEVQIYFAENHIVFEFDQTVVVSRLIEGVVFSELSRCFPATMKRKYISIRKSS